PRPRVADGDAVVDQGAAFARRIPGGHRVGPDFELQGRGDAVVRVVAVALGVLAVGVEVDESGGGHGAAHVERLPRGGELGRDGGDANARYRDVARGGGLRRRAVPA